jgi:hypothetical protein
MGEAAGFFTGLGMAAIQPRETVVVQQPPIIGYNQFQQPIYGQPPVVLQQQPNPYGGVIAIIIICIMVMFLIMILVARSEHAKNPNCPLWKRKLRLCNENNCSIAYKIAHGGKCSENNCSIAYKVAHGGKC